MAERVRVSAAVATLVPVDLTAPDDAAVVAAMAAGDPAGLEWAYRRYADRLHAYARSIVGDHDAAADVVHDTLLLAQDRVRQLREPDRLGSWLYAIARNECLRRVRVRKRTVSLAEAEEPVLDTDPGRALHAAQVREVVHAAANGLTDGDREVFELTVRHGLSAAEVAGVLGVSGKHAHARMSRSRTQFEAALGALLLARDGGGRCDTLRDLLAGWDGRLTVLLRKRIERHVSGCAECADRRRERMQPASLLAAYGALPFLAVADRLLPRATATATGGGPGRVRQTPGRRLATVAAVAVVLVAVVVSIAIGVQLARSGPDLTAAQPSAPPTAAVSGEPAPGLTPGGTSGSATPPPTAGPVPTATTPTGSAPTPAPAAFAAQAAARMACGSANDSLIVGVETAGAALASARLYWRTSSATAGSPTALAGPPSTTAMTVTGSTATRTITLTAHQATWWVVVTATDGRTVTTSQVTTVNTCP